MTHAVYTKRTLQPIAQNRSALKSRIWLLEEVTRYLLRGRGVFAHCRTTNSKCFSKHQGLSRPYTRLPSFFDPMLQRSCAARHSTLNCFEKYAVCRVPRCRIVACGLSCMFPSIQTSDTAELLREKYAKKVLLSGGKQLQVLQKSNAYLYIAFTTNRWWYS